MTKGLLVIEVEGPILVEPSLARELGVPTIIDHGGDILVSDAKKELEAALLTAAGYKGLTTAQAAEEEKKNFAALKAALKKSRAALKEKK